MQVAFSKYGSALAGFVLLSGLCAAGFQSPPKSDHAATSPKRAGEMFAQRCANCHVAPDLGFATDRAWVEQVRETA